MRQSKTLSIVISTTKQVISVARAAHKRLPTCTFNINLESLAVKLIPMKKLLSTKHHLNVDTTDQRPLERQQDTRASDLAMKHCSEMLLLFSQLFARWTHHPTRFCSMGNFMILICWSVLKAGNFSTAPAFIMTRLVLLELNIAFSSLVMELPGTRVEELSTTGSAKTLGVLNGVNKATSELSVVLTCAAWLLIWFILWFEFWLGDNFEKL